MKGRGVRRKLVGVVISHSMDKTAVVRVDVVKKHKMYKKYITTKRKYLAHDPNNSCQVGDKVKILECRPMSKTKRWHVLEIIGESKEKDLAIETQDRTEQAG